MSALAQRVARRFILAGSVRVVVDVPETMVARAKHPLYKELVVGEFAGSASLYRVFDGEELERILATGRITGGQYSVKPERERGASWGADLSEVVRAMNPLRGRRLGEKLYLAKLDPNGKTFSHLDPELRFDPEGPPQQPLTMPLSACRIGLGCSVADVHTNDVDFYRVELDGKTTPIRNLKKELKRIEKELRPGLRDPVRDPEWGLQPKDKLVVEMGSRQLGVTKGYPARVRDLWQEPGEREVRVKLFFPYPLGFGRPGFKNKNELTLYAIHPNRLSDRVIRLRNSRGNKIEVRRK